jgi:hypothetical protein
MNNYNSNEQDDLPKEKKNPPLGKWLLFKLLSLNNFPFGRDRNKEQPLTTVSNHKDQPQMLSSVQEDERSPSLCSHDIRQGRLDKPAGKADPSTSSGRNTAWSIKIFLN